MRPTKSVGLRTIVAAAGVGLAVSAVLWFLAMWAYAVPVDPLDRDPPRPAETPAAPPGYTPFPSAQPAPAVKPPADSQCPSGIADLRAAVPDEAGSQVYVDNRKTQLDGLALADPGKIAGAGVNLTRLLSPTEAEKLIDELNLDWSNIYWEASNGVHGAMAVGVGPQSLSDLESHLKTEDKIGVDDVVLGSPYFTLLPTRLDKLDLLDKHELVRLVDVGRLDELDEAMAEFGPQCVRFAVPDPLSLSQ